MYLYPLPRAQPRQVVVVRSLTVGFEDGDLGGGGGLVAGGDGDRVSLPDEAVTYDIANQLGCKLEMEGKYEEAKVFWLAALEGRRRVLGEEHKNTLASMFNLGNIHNNLEDHNGALDYYEQAFRVGEKVQGKTHPDTLMTIMNMANIYMDGLEDFVKAEMMHRQALDGFEKSLGKEHEDTKNCARNLARVYVLDQPNVVKARLLVEVYPSLLSDPNVGHMIQDFIEGEVE